MKTITRSLSLFLALTVVSCVTINIYFPAEEIRGAADKIVNEVWGDRPQNGTEELAPPPTENPLAVVITIFCAQQAHTLRRILMSAPRPSGPLKIRLKTAPPH